MTTTSTARRPLTTDERATYRALWKTPRCSSCKGPLYLRVPGREQCEKCQPTDWPIQTGSVTAGKLTNAPEWLPGNEPPTP